MIDGPACRLHVERVGTGEPVTVFAHGLGSSSEDLRPLAERLPGTVVLFDLRGHGRSDSPPPEAGYDHAAMRADLEHVADRFGATRALGVSMGAGALMNLLADRPERFERLAFVIPSRIDDPCPDVEGTLRMAGELESLPLAVIAERLMAMPDLQRVLGRHPAWEGQIHGQIMRMNATGVPRAFRAYATGGPPVHDGELLRAVRVPAMIAVNRTDPNHPAAVGHRLAELLPNAALHAYDDFAMFIDDLDDFARLVSRTLTTGGSHAAV